MNTAARTTAWAVFRHRDFALLCSSRLAASLAIHMQTVAVGWLVYALTASAFALGLVGLATFLPMVSLALVTGHVADQVDRRLILIGCYGAIGTAALGLLAFVLFDSQHAWPVFLLVLLNGTARAFLNPASQAMVPNVVPGAELGRAIALNSSVGQIATITGPALGGAFYAIEPTVPFAAAVVLLLIATLLAFLIRYRPSPRPRQRASWATLVAGIIFIRSQPVILGASSLDLFAVLLGGATALLPIYARDILLVGPWGLGLLRSMPAAGAALMALYLAHFPLRRRVGRRMLQAVALFGVATIGFGLSQNLFLSLACLFVMGLADMVSVVIRQTLIQLETPDAMRGRVAAVNHVFIGASNELGEFESGTLAALVGAMPAVVIGGIGTILVTLLWARWFPELRRRDTLQS